MKNYKLIIGYDGTRYLGWEHQPGKATIQGKIEEVIAHIDDKNVEVIGAGRTDAGVHAKGMVAHVKMDTDMNPKQLQDYMNHYLPDDIVIIDVKEAGERFHARYNATGKTYCYTLFDGDTKPLFDRKYVWTLDRRLDLNKMQKGAEYLLGSHDFSSFCKLPKKNKSNVRTIDKIEIKRNKDYVTLSFHGDGFLRNMVRILTGTLVGVGLGEIRPEEIKDILEGQDREKAGVTAPAKGLCLIEVDYQ